MCYAPVMVARWTDIGYPAKGKKRVKNFSDEAPRPCGKCVRCRKMRSYDWVKRLWYEARDCYTVKFVTLTYDEENVPYKSGNKTLRKSDAQKFLKRLRRHQERFADDMPQVRYYLIGEYGTKTDRPHYHLILFNVPHGIYEKLPEIWPHGHTDIRDVTVARMAYVANYVMEGKKNEFEDKEAQFATMSKRPAIGYNYLRNAKWTRNTLSSKMLFEGKKVTLPKTLFNKIYSEKHTDGREFEFKAWKYFVTSENKRIAEEKEEELLERLLQKGIALHEHNKEMELAEIRRYNRNKKVKL